MVVEELDVGVRAAAEADGQLGQSVAVQVAAGREGLAVGRCIARRSGLQIAGAHDLAIRHVGEQELRAAAAPEADHEVALIVTIQVAPDGSRVATRDQLVEEHRREATLDVSGGELAARRGDDSRDDGLEHVAGAPTAAARRSDQPVVHGEADLDPAALGAARIIRSEAHRRQHVLPIDERSGVEWIGRRAVVSGQREGGRVLDLDPRAIDVEGDALRRAHDLGLDDDLSVHRVREPCDPGHSESGIPGSGR